MWEKFLADLPWYLLNLGAFVTVVIVTWLWARTRFVAEIAKYKVEIASLQMNRNDQLFELEDICKEKNERLRLILKDLRMKLHRKQLDMVQARRNELSNVFMLDYCKSMQQYTRLADEVYEFDREKRRQFIENHINPFLQLAGDILEVVNQPNIMELLGDQATAIQFNYMEFDFAFDFVKKKMRFVDFDLRRAMREHLKRLDFQKAIKIHN